MHVVHGHTCKQNTYTRLFQNKEHKTRMVHLPSKHKDKSSNPQLSCDARWLPSSLVLEETGTEVGRIPKASWLARLAKLDKRGLFLPQ